MSSPAALAAASRGAHDSGARVLGLLPGTDASAANEWVDEVIATGLAQGRNVKVVEAADGPKDPVPTASTPDEALAYVRTALAAE